MLGYKYAKFNGKWKYSWAPLVPGDTFCACCGATVVDQQGIQCLPKPYDRGITVVSGKVETTFKDVKSDVVETKNGTLTFFLNPV